MTYLWSKFNQFVIHKKMLRIYYLGMVGTFFTKRTKVSTFNSLVHLKLAYCINIMVLNEGISTGIGNMLHTSKAFAAPKR